MVKIRLKRGGTKRRPFYDVVVSDSRSKRDGRFIEIVGKYRPMNKDERIRLDMERINHWIGDGAQPTKIVSDIMRKLKQAEA